MKRINYFGKLLTIMMVAMLSVGFASCSSDDDDDDDSGKLDMNVPTVTVDPATEVSASYTGTLKPVGYTNEPARCYVTITRLSDDAVRLSSLICEKFEMDMNAVNLTIKKQSDGRITLQSETSKSIEGTYYQGQLTLSFSTPRATYYFSGVKNK